MRSQRLILGVVGAALALGLSLSASATDFTKDEATIKAIEHEIADAATIDQFMRHIDKEAVLYDFVPPLQYKGTTSVHDDFNNFFSNAKDPKGEFVELVVVTDGKMGMARSIQHFTWKDKDDKPQEATIRVTDVFHKVKGQWKVMHSHISVPVDPKTGQGQMNLKS